AIGRPAGPSNIRRVVATSSPVDAIAVPRQAVWLAVGGLVVRGAPGTGGGRGGLGGGRRGRAAPDRPGHRPADRAEPGPGQLHRRRRRRGLHGVLPGPGPRGRGPRPLPARGPAPGGGRRPPPP